MESTDMMQAPIDREGTFRCSPIAWTLKTFPPKKSVALSIRFRIWQKWENEDGWSGEWPIGWFVEADAWVVGKDGSLRDRAIEDLAKAGLWNGDWDAIAGDPPNVYVLVDVEPDDRGVMRGQWINPDAPEPRARGRGFAPVDRSVLDAMRSRFGGSTRAIAGGARPASTAGPATSPNGSAQASPGAPPPPPPASGGAPATGATPSDPWRPSPPPDQRPPSASAPVERDAEGAADAEVAGGADEFGPTPF